MLLFLQRNRTGQHSEARVGLCRVVSWWLSLRFGKTMEQEGEILLSPHSGSGG